MEATCQRFRNKSPGKITGYEIVVTVPCDAKTWHVSNSEIHGAHRKKLDETAMPVNLMFIGPCIIVIVEE